MAYRDRTDEFATRRTNLKQRNLRFKLRQLADKTPYLPLFQPKSQLKALGMDRALLQETREFAGMEATAEVQVPEWVRFVDDANEAIRLLQVKLEYLQMVHTRRLMIRFDGAEDQHEREIDQLNDEVTQLFQCADRSLKQITRPFVGGQPTVSAADRLVRVNTQRSIACRLQQISVKFRQRQREYLHRLQLQKFGSDMFDFDPDDADAAALSNDPARYQASQWSAQADLAVEMQRFKIESRDAEIQRIARSVSALATIFKEVAEMVIDQGTLVDRIDYNMEQVAERARSGLKELQRAEKYQRNTRPERCIKLLLSAIFLCFVILYIKHS